MNKTNFAPQRYSIILGDIRYDKNLSLGAKVLYAEISALAKKEGFCFCANSHFEEIYGVDTRTIQRWLYDLQIKGHIKVEILDDKKVGKKRKIYIHNCHIIASKMTPPLASKMTPPPSVKNDGSGEGVICINNINIKTLNKKLRQTVKTAPPGKEKPSPIFDLKPNGIQPKKRLSSRGSSAKRPKKSKAVYIFHCISRCWPNSVQEDLINSSEIKDLLKWEEVIKAWLAVGYSPKNVLGMLDWYKNGIQRYNKPSGNNGGNGKNFLNNIGEFDRGSDYYKNNVKTIIIESGKISEN